MRNPLKLILFSCAVVLLMTMASCGSPRAVTGASTQVKTTSKTTQPSHNHDKKHSKNHGKKAEGDLASALVDEARTWLGTPYSYGGTSRSGADCSGFVMEVFKEAAGIALPRNSRAQSDFCEYLDKDELEVGDLVFFSSQKSGGQIAHVGMYIGNGTMIHASSSRGVIESSLNQNYYITHYVGAGRIPQIASVKPPRKRKVEPVVKPVEPEAEPEKLLAVNEEQKMDEAIKVEEVAVAESAKSPASIVRNAFGAARH